LGEGKFKNPLTLKKAKELNLKPPHPTLPSKGGLRAKVVCH